MAQPAREPAGRDFPRVPAYAWSWLQRSRPVLVEAADRLTGAPPSPGFVDGLRRRFETDPFTRDVVVGVVADVAFGGRLPSGRPPGASWDRGLTWWAAAIAGTTPEQFESRAARPASQRRLFGDDGPSDAPTASPTRPPQATSAERAMLVSGLRGLLATAEGDCVPAAAVRSLLAAIDASSPTAGPPPPQ